jgi:hypothetical protein
MSYVKVNRQSLSQHRSVVRTRRQQRRLEETKKKRQKKKARKGKAAALRTHQAAQDKRRDLEASIPLEPG